MNMKKGQVTLFIVIAIVIVSAILIFILWVKPTYVDDGGKRPIFEGCVEDALEQAVKELGEKAGFVNPEFTYNYLGEEIPYLCYINEYYKTCVIQKPFLKQHFEDQMKELIEDQVRTCYDNSIGDLNSRGFNVKRGEVEYEISLEPSRVIALINAPTTVGSQTFKKFEPKIDSPIYEMLMVSTSILQYETQLGDSDTTSLMNLYPDLIIDKLKQGEGTTIYILENKIYGTKFKFASRSLAWPAGYDI